MGEIDRLAIHERATAYDAGDAGACAFLGCRGGDAALAKGAVEPDAADVAGGGLLHDLLGDVGVGGDDQAIEFTGNAGEVWIAGCAFDFGGVGVDGKHFVAGCAEFAEHGVRGALPPARYASDGDALSAEKIGNERGDLWHGCLLRAIQSQRRLHNSDSGHLLPIRCGEAFRHGSSRALTKDAVIHARF